MGLVTIFQRDIIYIYNSGGPAVYALVRSSYSVSFANVLFDLLIILRKTAEYSNNYYTHGYRLNSPRKIISPAAWRKYLPKDNDFAAIQFHSD